MFSTTAFAGFYCGAASFLARGNKSGLPAFSRGEKLVTMNKMFQGKNAFWHRVVPCVNLFLVAICICGNIASNAGFCRPVLWAAIVQAVSFLNVISFTKLEQTRMKGVNALLCGISTCVYVYWCLFLGMWVMFMPVPLWFLILLVWRNMVRPVHPQCR
ncbi:MAG: hypothetical protein SPL12_05515 [Bacteroidales bacterium]|nr:hypothetical protein [Bacteroidales bacterium]